MQRPSEFRVIVSVWLCILVLFGATLLVFPRITAELARFDRYGFDARFQGFMSTGGFRAAERESLLALTLDPQDIAGRYSLGEALESNGDLTSAAEEFRRAAGIIERFPFVNADDRSREYGFWFRYHFSRNEWLDALAAFYLLPDTSSMTSEIRRDVVTAAVEARCWSTVVELSDDGWLEAMMPDDMPACTEFAQACLDADKTNLAERAFARAAEKGIEMAAFCAGLLVLERGDEKEAERFFERAPTGFREYGLARVRHVRGEVAQANELYKQALKVRESDIEWLCDAFDAAQRAGDTEQTERIVTIVQQLEPTFARLYEVNPRLVLGGLTLDTPWLSRDRYLTVTFFWHVGEPCETEQLVVVDRRARNLVARAGKLVFHKTTVRNLCVEPGLEIGAPGQRYPLGFAAAQGYPSTPSQCRIVADEQADHSGDQCLLLAGTRKRPINCIESRRFKVSGGAHYVLGGNLRTRGGDAHMACLWFDASGQMVLPKVSGRGARERTQWTPMSMVVRAPYSPRMCSVRISNWKSEGESLFDDIFFIEVPLERSVLGLL